MFTKRHLIKDLKRNLEGATRTQNPPQTKTKNAILKMTFQFLLKIGVGYSRSRLAVFSIFANLICLDSCYQFVNRRSSGLGDSEVLTIFTQIVFIIPL